jgi:hypothetical protein
VGERERERDGGGREGEEGGDVYEILPRLLAALRAPPPT